MILDRYILKEHVSPFVFWTLVITIIMLFNHILLMMKMLVEKGVPAGVVLELFLLMLPFIIVLAVPMSILFATVLAFSRFGNDSELIAMKANGISLFRMTLPVFLAGILIAGFLFYFQDKVLPETNHRMKSLMTDIMRKKPAMEIQERVFINDFKGLRIYIGDVDHRTSEISDIIITDFQKNGLPATITSPKGRISTSKDGSTITLELQDGELLEFESNSTEKTRLGRFETLRRFLEIDNELQRHDRNVRGDREMNLSMLRERIDEEETKLVKVEEEMGNLYPDKEKEEKPDMIDRKMKEYRSRKESILRHINKYKVEIHKKYALSIACLPFILIGIPLGTLGQYRKNSLGIIISLTVYVFYWVFLIGGEDLADRGMIAPWVSMWTPNIVLGIIGIILYIKMHGKKKVSTTMRSRKEASDVNPR